MVEFKLVINDPKTGKSTQKEVKDDIAKKFLGLRTGSIIKGELIDMTGYELEIKGGSDYAGFPMRPDLKLSGRKKVLITKGVGLRDKRKGLRKRKTVCGNTIDAKIVQINLKITKYGKPLKEENKEISTEKKQEDVIVEKKEEKPTEKKTEVKEETKEKKEEASKKEEKSNSDEKEPTKEKTEVKEEASKKEEKSNSDEKEPTKEKTEVKEETKGKKEEASKKEEKSNSDEKEPTKEKTEVKEETTKEEEKSNPDKKEETTSKKE